MKGDFVQVSYRTPVGVAVEKIQAEKDGSSVDFKLPGRNDPFLTIEVFNKAGKALTKALFSSSEIIAIREGHETLSRKTKTTRR
jgi:hypothetical protein